MMTLRSKANLFLHLGAAVCLTVASVRGGQTAEPVSLLDLAGRRVQPLRTIRSKAVVFLFARSDCPVSNRYAPEAKRLYEKFAPRGVIFWLVYPDPGENARSIRKHLKQYEYPFGALRDPTHALVKAAAARVTPEAAVFAPGGKLVYHGRIDDLYVDFGKTRRAPTTHELEEVLDAVVEGKAPLTKPVPAVGCFISDLK